MHDLVKREGSSRCRLFAALSVAAVRLLRGRRATSTPILRHPRRDVRDGTRRGMPSRHPPRLPWSLGRGGRVRIARRARTRRRDFSL